MPEPTQTGPSPEPSAGSDRGGGGRRRPEFDVTSVVEERIRQAQRRGDFDDLPGSGRPLDLGPLDAASDPDWWLKKLVDREGIVLLPASVQLRKDDAALDAALDAQASEDDVRSMVEDFNRRVLAARYGTPSGPPLITMPRDVDQTVAAWRARRLAREEDRRARDVAPVRSRVRRRWWQPRRRG